MNLEPIPLVDLVSQHKEIAEEVLSGFERVLSDTSFIGGSDVGAFEHEFAEYTHSTHCVGVANGTDAIELALRANGIGRGDRVVIPANTFIATAEAVVRAGADIELVDCDSRHLLIDTDQAAGRLRAGARAVIGVDLYGQIAPFEFLTEAAATHGALVFEDAAQSQGATRHGRSIGADVAAAATSFYPGKNLGAYGDAGAVVLNDADAALRLRAIAAHGGTRKYQHDYVGMNSRLDTLQAVVLRAKLKRLDGWNAARRTAAERYISLLADIDGVVAPSVATGNVHVWHLFVVQVDPERRDDILTALHNDKVGAGIHYPQPVHETGAFGDLGYGLGDFPVAEKAARSMVTLPLFPHITASQQERVIESLAKAMR
jgi:dTDP-4-amino-4,6-dideoxygalactose transaminase